MAGPETEAAHRTFGRAGRTKWEDAAAQHSQEQVEEERKTKKNTWGHKHAEKQRGRSNSHTARSRGEAREYRGR